MNNIDFDSSIKNYVSNLQTQAARGMLGCHIYKQIINRSVIYMFGTTLLFGAATSASIAFGLTHVAPIVLGFGTLGFLAISINYIFHRFDQNRQGKKLVPVYQAVLDGDISSAYSLYDREIQKAGAGSSGAAYNKLRKWFDEKPYFDPIKGWQTGTKKEFFFEFSFNLTVLAAINTQDKGELDKQKHQIDSWYGISIPDGSKKILEFFQLLDSPNKSGIKIDKVNICERLQRDISDNLKLLKDGDKIPENTEKYIEYVNQYFPKQ